MTRTAKQHLRLAIAIHEQLRIKPAAIANTCLPAAAWQQCEQRARRMRRAEQRGWRLAADRLRDDLRHALQRLRRELTISATQLEPPPDTILTASIADIQADLLALQEEFEDVTFDRRDQTVSVSTEPIELEEVYLGRFRICLKWSDLAEDRPHNYRAIALDANPAATNEGVTHPHVQDEVVCEGEGSQPIRHALEQGRLLDFFLIVAHLLRTYNEGSPYVALSDWHGVECADCGATVCDDERWTCERCGTSLCGDCRVDCPGCDGVYCGACVTCCKSCDNYHCSSCGKQCAGCRAELCRDCFDDKERCSDCHEQETPAASEESTSGEASSQDSVAVAALQPDGVGQVVVPA